MKRLAVTLSIIALLAVASPYFPILAQPSHIPHQNPATAKGSPDPASLLRFYGDVFELAAIRQYRGAQSLLTELEYTDIPGELRHTVNLANSRVEQLLTTLNSLEALLDETSILFTRDQVSDAEQKLSEAETAVRSSLFLLEDVEAVTDTLGNELGVFAAAAGGEIKQAYERQQQALSRQRQIIEELEQLRQSLGLNPLMEIEASFHYPTLVEISAPETAYAGLPITISGQVSSTGGEVERTIKVLLDDIQVTEEIMQGPFSFQITVPPQISIGKHSLTVEAAPQGRYAGASESLPINILGIPITTEIQVPIFTIIPETIRISGQVYQGITPVADARISLVFREHTTIVKTSADGSFTATIEAPFNLSLVGPQELTATVEPVEPWYASLEIKRGIFTINPANIGVMLIAFISLGLLVFNRVRSRTTSPRREMLTAEARIQELPVATLFPRPEYELAGIKGRILTAYMSGLRAVEKVSGTPMAPRTTLREFAKAVTPWLPTAIEPFSELTTITEYALYSAHKLDEDAAARAELLAGTIKEELHSDAA